MVGDDVFTLKTWLVKPYHNRGLTNEQRIFNYSWSSTQSSRECLWDVGKQVNTSEIQNIASSMRVSKRCLYVSTHPSSKNWEIFQAAAPRSASLVASWEDIIEHGIVTGIVEKQVLFGKLKTSK